MKLVMEYSSAHGAAVVCSSTAGSQHLYDLHVLYRPASILEMRTASQEKQIEKRQDGYVPGEGAQSLPSVDADLLCNVYGLEGPSAVVGSVGVFHVFWSFSSLRRPMSLSIANNVAVVDVPVCSMTSFVDNSVFSNKSIGECRPGVVV